MATYMIFGMGKQGQALAYYLSKYYNADSLLLIDIDSHIMASALSKLIPLLEGSKTMLAGFNWKTLGFKEEKIALDWKVDVVISALPHKFNMEITDFATRVGASYCDFGFNEDIVRNQLKIYGNAAKEKGITILPNCGVGPGLVNMISVGEARENNWDAIHVYIGGNPQKPENAWMYEKLFAGLANEYAGEVKVLEEGFIDSLPALECLEEDVRICGDRYDAFLAQTSFGLTLEILEGLGVQEAFEKTLRWPGHYAVIKAMQELGFFDEQPVVGADGLSVVPFNLTSVLFDRMPMCKQDMMAIKIYFERYEETDAEVEILIHSDDNFTAMQRATASVVAIVANMMAQGKLPRGAYLPESVVDYKEVLREFKRLMGDLRSYEVISAWMIE